MQNKYWIVLALLVVLALLIAFARNQEGFDAATKPTSTLHPTIESIYYINLDRREDRKQEFLDNFPADDPRIVRIPAHYYPSNGAVGCLMSHITALSRAYNESPGENILICEDDFTIKDMDYCNHMLELLFSKIPTWDVVMLGQNTIHAEDTGIETEGGAKITMIKNSQTTSGYLIKKQYIPTLLEIYVRDLNEYVKTGVWGNYYVDQSWKVLQTKDRWYSFSPTVAVQRPSFSDIQNGYINTEI